MSEPIKVLLVTAVSIGFIHTLIGPDHYLPFIFIAKARNWSRFKIFWITLASGLGHVLSSVALGLVGIALGIAVFRLESVESVRGDIAAWGLIMFGLAYGIWGLRGIYRSRPHTHGHEHAGNSDHVHAHKHLGLHSHVHEGKDPADITPWVLFAVFVLGPCEPLIPILMYPAAENNMFGVMLVTLAFGAVTIATMLALVFIGTLSLRPLPLTWMAKYSHTLAGTAILLCGVAIKLGL